MAKSPRTTIKNVLAIPRPRSMTRSRSTTLTTEAIAARAFALYEERGCQHGHDLDNWLQAERELQQTVGSSAAQPVIVARRS